MRLRIKVLGLVLAFLSLSAGSFGQVTRGINNLEAPTAIKPTVKGNIGPIEAELKENGQVSMASISCGGSGEGPPQTAVEIMHSMFCGASAVLIGSAVGKQSKLNEDGSWIVTDYSIHAERIFKNDGAAAIRRGDNVTVTMSGGQISIDGKTAMAKDENIFLNSSDLYIFFLQRMPANREYAPMSGSGFVSAADGKLYTLGGRPENLAETSLGYLDLISTVAKTPCQKPQK